MTPSSKTGSGWVQGGDRQDSHRAAYLWYLLSYPYPCRPGVDLSRRGRRGSAVWPAGWLPASHGCLHYDRQLPGLYLLTLKPLTQGDPRVPPFQQPWRRAYLGGPSIFLAAPLQGTLLPNLAPFSKAPFVPHAETLVMGWKKAGERETPLFTNRAFRQGQPPLTASVQELEPVWHLSLLALCVLSHLPILALNLVQNQRWREESPGQKYSF